MSQRILLVEDNPDDVELTRLAFQQSGLGTEVLVAQDGEEALALLFGKDSVTSSENAIPQLVLLDLKIPKINGLEVLRRIRSNMRTARLPVIILTSSTENSDINRGYELGANSFVRKPVDFHQFTETIDHLQKYWLNINLAAPVTG